MKRYWIFIAFCLLVVSCATNRGNANNDTIGAPPQRLNANDAAAAVITEQSSSTPQTASTKRNASAGTSMTSTPRIEEIRDNGGTVSQIKVNNHNDIPDYYIYPNSGATDSNAPSSNNVATPKWQINW